MRSGKRVAAEDRILAQLRAPQDSARSRKDGERTVRRMPSPLPRGEARLDRAAVLLEVADAEERRQRLRRNARAEPRQLRAPEGISPSPQALSGGPGAALERADRAKPALAAERMAAASPAGPPPAMTTS